MTLNKNMRDALANRYGSRDTLRNLRRWGQEQLTVAPHRSPEWKRLLKDPTGYWADQKQRLRWAPPDLGEAPTTVNITGVTRIVQNQPNVIVNITGTMTRGIFIENCGNVILRGGSIQIDEPWGDEEGTKDMLKGINIKNCTGTVYIEGIHASGDTLEDFIYIQSPDATVIVQNCRADGLNGQEDDGGLLGHADVIQVRACKELYVDKLTASTEYQGLFIKPENPSDTVTDLVDFRRVDLVGVTGDHDTARYLVWLRATNLTAANFHDVYITPSTHASHDTLGQAVYPDDNDTFPRQARNNYNEVEVTWPVGMAPAVSGKVYLRRAGAPRIDFVPLEAVDYATSALYQAATPAADLYQAA